MVTRRQLLVSAPALATAWATLPGCSMADGPHSYEATAERTWQVGDAGDAGNATPLTGTLLGQELVRCATLAPSSHNTQCSKFAIDGALQSITVLPDRTRRCPAVDPDEHHLFVSLGCATENLIHAAQAHGLRGEAQFDPASDGVRVTLTPVQAQRTPLFLAMAHRQCTRGDYDAQPLSNDDLRLLERAGSAGSVRVLLLTDRPAIERVLGYVLQGNTAQMADPAFVNELKTWIRFNGAQAVRTGDGLFSVASGSPAIPTWLGNLAFSWLLTAKGENEKYVRQVRSSAGIAVFAGLAADKENWVEVGRCYERFALQATTLGIRNAFLNQPVEVPTVRAPFAEALGLAGQRPDLVVRFGRGPLMPRSLRRPVRDVLM
jgi:hypothetical protein